jgi:hypothetical protein
LDLSGRLNVINATPSLFSRRNLVYSMQPS